MDWQVCDSVKNCKIAGIIGTGWIAELHARALTALNVPIAAVVGRDGEKTRIFAGKWNIPIYGTETEILYAAKLDVVHICTPPASHYAQIKEAFSHKKHVFCEKPLCLEPNEAVELAALAETHMLIAKSEREGRTYTTVTPLDLEGRKRELARIIGGTNITEITLKSAEEMLRG